MANISEFAQQFGQGVRPTLFRVEGNFPSGGATTEQVDFFIKAATLPASTLGVVEVPYKGRKIKRPGDRTFTEWTVTVLASDGFPIRSAFNKWMNTLNDHVEITQDVQLGQEWNVTAIKPDGTDHENGTYTFINVFPTEVGTIDMNYETVDTIAEFTVTLHYDYWTGGGV
jgi:hypothetical protein